MDDYKERFINEYQELSGRIEKLKDILTKNMLDELDFELACPVVLLSEQLETMMRYADILRERAEIEEINLNKED